MDGLASLPKRKKHERWSLKDRGASFVLFLMVRKASFMLSIHQFQPAIRPILRRWAYVSRRGATVLQKQPWDRRADRNA